MARLLALFMVLAAASVQGMNVDEKAHAWLKAHQIPQVSDLDVLRQEDPRTFAAVRGLLNRQALGTLGEKSALPAKQLSAEQMKQFTYSKTTQDEKTVLALTTQMLKQKDQFEKLQNSKATQLSKKLDGEVKAEKPKPKPVFRKPAPVVQEQKVEVPELEGLDDPMPQKKKLAVIARASKTSWGDLKSLAKAAVTGKVQHKKVEVPHGPSLGWDKILKNMHRTQQEQLTGKNSALAGFSWGEDEAAAKGEQEAPKPEISNLATGFVKVPADLGMGDDLANFIHSGKQAAPAAIESPAAVAETAGNPYSMELN